MDIDFTKKVFEEQEISKDELVELKKDQKYTIVPLDDTGAYGVIYLNQAATIRVKNN